MDCQGVENDMATAASSPCQADFAHSQHYGSPFWLLMTTKRPLISTTFPYAENLQARNEEMMEKDHALDLFALQVLVSSLPSASILVNYAIEVPDLNLLSSPSPA